MKIDYWNISDKIIKFFLTLILGVAMGYFWAYQVYKNDKESFKEMLKEHKNSVVVISEDFAKEIGFEPRDRWDKKL